MEALLLAIYAFFVWLIFIKLKWLPWNTASQVTVVIIPIVGMAVLILLLNMFAPSSSDVRVIKYVVQVVPQVRGRVLEVPIEGNRLYRKGEVLFSIDPTPYQFQVKTLEAQLADAQSSSRQLDESLKGATAKVSEMRQARAQAAAQSREINASLRLARQRVQQHTELVKTGAGNKFDLESAITEVNALEEKLAKSRAAEMQAQAGEVQARANAQQVREKIAGKANGEYAPVAQIRAQLENARWELEQTVFRAPADGTVINLQLRPGSFVASIPITAVMSFVEEEYQVIALFNQNELHQVAPGDAAEIALKTYPGKVIKATVDSIVWAQGQGQLPLSGTVPQTSIMTLPPARYAVKLNIAERDRAVFLAAGAAGDAAIYTEHLAAIHIIRMVILRVGSYINYLILKLH